MAKRRRGIDALDLEENYLIDVRRQINKSLSLIRMHRQNVSVMDHRAIKKAFLSNVYTKLVIKDPSRARSLVEKRVVMAKALRLYFTLQEIGTVMDKNYTTIIHYLRYDLHVTDALADFEETVLGIIDNVKNKK